MRKTPRTDAVWGRFRTDTTGQLEPDVEFSTLARMLECELQEAKERIKRLEEVTQERDKEWFQVIESILGFHPVSMTEALHIGIERIKKQKQRIKQLEKAGDVMYTLLDPPSISMRTTEYDNALQGWDDAKIK